MNVYLPNSRLPSAYQEVEYIENNGTAYILTGLNIKDGYRNQMKVIFLAAAYADTYPGISGGYLGPDSGLSGGQGRFYLNGLQTNGKLNYGYLADFGDIGSGLSTGTDYEIDYSWISGNAFVKLNGNTLQSSSYTYSTSLQGQAPVGGGAHMDLNQYWANPGIRIYYSKFYNSAGTLVRDFVPCYRKSDNEIGLYDLVNNQFYTNSGTGTFSKGNDVTMAELKNAYIGEFIPFTPGANTLVYCPFQNDIKDYSGNNVSTSGGGTLVYENPGVRMSEWISINETTSLSNFTIMCYSKISSTSNWGSIFRRASITSSGYYGFDIEYNTDGHTDCVRVEVLRYQYSNVWQTTYYGFGVTSWHHFCFVVNGSMGYFYVDGVLKDSKNISGWTPYVGNYNLGNSSSLQTVGDYIIESKARTAQEIQEYYNNTKSTYGL